MARFIHRHYRRDIPADALRIVAAQSDEGRELLRSIRYPENEPPTSVILIQNPIPKIPNIPRIPVRIAVSVESTAALTVAEYLRYPYRALKWLLVVPKGLRDAVYRVVARHRR